MSTAIDVIAATARTIVTTTQTTAFWPMAVATLPMGMIVVCGELYLHSARSKKCFRVRALAQPSVFFYTVLLVVFGAATGLLILSSLSDLGDIVSTGLVVAVVAVPAFRWVISPVAISYASRRISLKPLLDNALADAQSHVIAMLVDADSTRTERRVQEILSGPDPEAVFNRTLSPQIRGSITRRATTGHERSILCAREVASREYRPCNPFV